MIKSGGELASLIPTIEYSSKRELLEKLRKIREGVRGHTEFDNFFRENLGVAIQQCFYTSERELLMQKKINTIRSKNENKKGYSIN